MPTTSKVLNFYLFANDTNIYYDSKSLQDFEKTSNEELNMNDLANKAFLQHFESIQNSPLSLTIDSFLKSITASDKTMDIGYRELFNLKYNDMLYNSMIDDSYIIIVTRWRLPSHKLYIETGRYKVPFAPRQDRTCMTCGVLEDEIHALFVCRAHSASRHKYQELLNEYSTVNNLLDPTNVNDLIRIAKYMQEIEKNMDTLKKLR